jgi:O-antigen/teichoic acid export membrane protein
MAGQGCMSKIDLRKTSSPAVFSGLDHDHILLHKFHVCRYLGVEIKGVYSYLYTVVGFAWLILDMGVYRSIPYLVRKFPDKLQEVFNLSVFLFVLESLLLGIVGLCCIGFWSSLLGLELSRGSLILIVMLITSSKFGMQLQSLYVGMDKIWNHSIAQLLSALFLVVMLLIVCFLQRMQTN